MRLLLDANLSPRLVTPLSDAGYDVTHVEALGLLTDADPVIFDRAVEDGYVVITADTDFPRLLALRRSASPSVILLRRVAELPPADHAALLLANLPSILEDLERGVVVSMSPTRMAIRDLPI